MHTCSYLDMGELTSIDAAPGAAAAAAVSAVPYINGIEYAHCCCDPSKFLKPIFYSSIVAVRQEYLVRYDDVLSRIYYRK